MSHLALYRKYRPDSFAEVAGQEHITRALGNAIDRGTFVHAYLFSGPRGCGKTSTARLVAQALNCEQGPTSTPCGTCRFCTSIRTGQCIDVIEMDAASQTGIDDIREAVIENAIYAPMEARFKVYIIDEVHDLSSKAFDALLKTIEEPPAHVLFILATTELGKVPLTVRSRCQKHEFRRGSLPDLVKRLETVVQREGWTAEPGALGAVARMADGGYRDALSLLEQVAGSGSGLVTLADVNETLGLVPDDLTNSLLRALSDHDGGKTLALIDEAMLSGREPRAVLESLIHKASELTRLVHGAEIGTIEPDRRALLHELATYVGKENLARFGLGLAEAHAKLRTSGLPRLWLEIALLGLTEKPAEVVGKAAPVKTAEPSKPEPIAKVAAVELPVDPELADMERAWRQTIENIIARGSKSAEEMLGTSRVIRMLEGTITIELASQFMYAKLEDPNGRTHRELQTNFRSTIGDDKWSLAYRLRSGDGPAGEEPAKVPMPLEGEELEKAIEEMGGERISNSK